jgi:glycosyltransferase involved in cell wall biosynthesis
MSPEVVDSSRVAFVQDHLVQRGGAERGLLSMLKAAPGARVVTPFYEPDACYPELGGVDVRTSLVNRIGMVRRHHRLALPVMPLLVRQLAVDADVVICGTSGWAQGVRTDGRKVVYFYALTRWLYERDAYLRGSGALTRVGAQVLRPWLARWDRKTMATGHRFITEGTVMQRRLREIYGIEAEIIPLPNTLDPTAPARPVPDLADGFFFCASRLMPYKNVDVLVEAFSGLPEQRLVVAGDGPLLERLRASAAPNVHLLGRRDDDELRWLYGACRAVITAAFEPFGLTPVEGAAFGKPTVALEDGGFVDTVVDGVTGVHFPRPHPDDVRAAVDRFLHLDLSPRAIRAHARQYDEPLFVDRIRRVIDEELGTAPS